MAVSTCRMRSAGQMSARWVQVAVTGFCIGGGQDVAAVGEGKRTSAQSRRGASRSSRWRTLAFRVVPKSREGGAVAECRVARWSRLGAASVASW